MGWREAWRHQFAQRGADYPALRVDRAYEALSAMPAPDRLALARELLKGTGMLIGPWLPAQEHMKALDVSGIGRIDGVRAYRYLLSQADPDACRAAILGDG